MKFKFFSITIFAILLISLALPQLVLARGLVPCGGTGEPKCNLCHFFQLLQNIINGASILVLSLAALFIVIGGIVILSSAGSPDRASEGKRMITYSIIGIIICFGAWMIINTVMNNALVKEPGQPGAIPWPWNRIKCEVSEPPAPPPPPITGGEWCICEIPVYATMDRTIRLFTEIQGTNLNSAENCKNNCITGNAAAYCPDRTTATNPKLYCAAQSDLQAKATFCYKQQTVTDSITGACFTNSNECYGAILSNSEYTKKCYFDDYLYCSCTQGLATWCTSSKPSGLYQTSKEVGVGGLFNAWDCIRNCGLSGGYCKLNPSITEPPSEQWCARSAPSGSNVWNLSGINPRQKGDASPQLASLLNCMYSRIPGLIITSISSDVLCSNPACDTTGYDCGHTANSCHYGGTNCTGYSYAVDFATNISCSSIRDAALACDPSAWVNWETNHTHISVNNTACGCNEGAGGASCP